MKSRDLQSIFVLLTLATSLLCSCHLPSEVNKAPVTPLPVEVIATPTEALVFTVPKDPEAYLSPEEFVGYYAASFEVSSFVPCAENDLPGPAKGYWIDIFRSSAFLEEYDSLVTEISHNENQVKETRLIVFVHFIGQRSNRIYDGYAGIDRRGHMALYKQEIIVIDIIEMKIMESNQCQTS
jgi:hypothetical protein